MTFSRDQVFSTFNYNLNGELLHHLMGPKNDLGIFFDQKQNFTVILTLSDEIKYWVLFDKYELTSMIH